MEKSLQSQTDKYSLMSNDLDESSREPERCEGVSANRRRRS